MDFYHSMIKMSEKGEFSKIPNFDPPPPPTPKKKTNKTKNPKEKTSPRFLPHSKIKIPPSLLER